jgi:DNA repair exonuclease SbcCD ATPase subunit
MEGGAISADMVADAFSSATAEGGKFHGMMEAQAEGLAGLKASLGDAWMNMLNELGEGNNELIAGGYKLTTSLVQNYETIGKALVSLVATYGAYKAAVVLATTAEKGWTVAQLAHFNVLLLVEKAQKLLNATMLANPYVLLGTIVVGLATTLWTLHDSTTAEEKAQKKLNDTLEDAKKKKEDLKSKSNELISVIKDETQTIYAQVEAWEALQEAIPEAFKGMSMDEFKELSPEDIQKAINTANGERYVKEIETAYKDQQKVVEDIQEKLRKKENSADSKSVLGKKQISNLKDELKAEENSLQSLKKKIEEIREIEEAEKKKKTQFSNISDESKKAAEDVDKLKKKLADLRSGKEQSTNYAADIEETATALDKAEKKLASLTGKDKKTVKAGESAAAKAAREAQQQADATTKLVNSEAKAALERRQIALENEQKLLDIEKDGWDKRQKQIELDHKKELLAIDKHAQELIEKQQEAEKLQWEKDGKQGTFVPKTKSILDLPREQKNELIQQETTLNKTTSADTAKLLKEQLEPYRTFAQQRIDIENKYQEDIKALRESGASDENIQVAEQAQKDALTALDEEMAQKEETFKELMLRIGYMSLQQLEQSLKEAEDALKKSEATGGKNTKESATLRAKIKTLQDELKAAKAEKEVKDSDPQAKWDKQSAAIKKCKKEVDGMIDSMDFLDETTKDALKAASNIADGAIAMIEGIKTLGIGAAASISAVEKASVILAIIGAAVQIVTAIFNMASKAEAEHQKVLAEVAANKLALQREYNLLLLEQNLLLEKATTIFGEKQIEKAANAYKVYLDAVKDYEREMARGLVRGGGRSSNRRDVSGALDDITIKTGHEKTGLFGWGSGRDVYTSLKDMYGIGEGGIVDEAGRLNIELAKTILNTQTMSDESKALLQNLIDLQEMADKAEEALTDYLQETFGSLGSDLTDAIVDSIKNGTDAWEAFGNAGAKVIENLGRQMIYELAFAEKFAQLQKDLKAIYDDTTLSPEEIAGKEMEVLEGFFDGMGDAVDYAERLGKQFQEEAAKRGFDIWQPDGENQTGKAGAFTTMTQEQGTKLEGLFTSVQDHTANIDDQIADISAVMYASSDTLLRIESNTAHCKRLEDLADNMAILIRDGLKVK